MQDAVDFMLRHRYGSRVVHAPGRSLYARPSGVRMPPISRQLLERDDAHTISRDTGYRGRHISWRYPRHAPQIHRQLLADQHRFQTHPFPTPRIDGMSSGIRAHRDYVFNDDWY